MATAEQKRVIRRIKSRIQVYAEILSQGVQSINKVPVANMITDLFTQLREIEAICGPDTE